MMTAGSVLLGISLLAAVALYLAYPFWGAPARQKRVRRSQHDILLEQKEALLAQIRNLDFDFSTGKIAPELHDPQRAELMAAATTVLQQLDDLEKGGTVTDDAMEAAIARARRTRSAKPDDAEIEAAVARARQPNKANGRTQFCPQCGHRVDATDKFCAACGHSLISVSAIP